MRAEDIEKLLSVGRPEIAPDGSFAVFAVSRPDLAANRAVGQLWRDRPARRHASSPHPRDGGCRSAPLAGRIAHRLPPRRCQGQVADLRRRRRRRRARAGDRRAARCRRVRLGTGRHGSRLHRAGARAGSLRLRRGTGCRGRGSTPHHRHPLARQWARLSRRPAVGAVRGGGPDHRRRAVLRARSRGAPRGRDPAQEAARAARGPSARPRATRSYSGAVFAGNEILTRHRRDRGRRSETFGRCSWPSAWTAAGERVVLDRDANLSISEVAVAPDGTVALLASDVGSRGHRLHRPRRRAVDPRVRPARAASPMPSRSTSARSAATSPASATTSSCRTARAGRVRLLRVTRAGEVDRGARRRRGGRAVTPPRRTGSSRPSPRRSRSASWSSIEDGAPRTADGVRRLRRGGRSRRSDRAHDRRPRRLPRARLGREAGRRRPVPGDPADPRRTICLVRHPSLR